MIGQLFLELRFFDFVINCRAGTIDGLPMNQGALYPVLRSLERAGLLSSQTEPSTSGPPRRYYSPTPEGKAEYRQWCQVWQQTRNWLDSVLEPQNEPTENKRSGRASSRS